MGIPVFCIVVQNARKFALYNCEKYSAAILS